MSDVELFVQGEGIPTITLIRVPADAPVRALIEAARPYGLTWSGDEVYTQS